MTSMGKVSLIKLLFAFVLVQTEAFSQNTNQNDLKLWYLQPAKNWNEALPLGNGRIGAMVFGSPAQERLQLNEETVWSGGPGNNVPENFNESLPVIRQLIFEGKYQEAQQLAQQKLTASGRHNGMCYQPVGNFYIDFPEHKEVTNYYRDLDIQQAVASVRYESDGTNYRREIFSSFSDEVVIVRLTSSKRNGISCILRTDSPQENHQVKTTEDQLILSGSSGDHEGKSGQVRFKTLIYPKVEGGTVTVEENAIEIADANVVTIYVSIGTNFKNYKDLSGDESKLTFDFLSKAIKRPYNKAKADHVGHYREYFDRVTLDLGRSAAADKPTDVRLSEFATANDPLLVSLYFQYGRYLLISSSQPGTQPANLQGIWNDKIDPPWDSKYTVNINTEMNYWPAEATNLSEMHEPLFVMLKDLSQTGQESASEMYGARGWNMHHNTDIWRITGPVDGAFYGLWPMGGAWLSQHMWQHYLYTGDEKFLKEVYPVLKGAAWFYMDALQKDPNTGWLVVTPSMSPENAHHDGVSIAAGTTMDNQLVFDVFSNVIAAAQILNLDPALADSLLEMRDRLPPMHVGQHGQLQEWLHDWDQKEDKHRHVSHLYGLFPGNQISPYSHPELFQAVRNALVYRGDKSTGWSMGWKVNLWARLFDGNRAYKLIADQLTPAGQETGGGTYPNLLDAHPPFQIDGNFGCTSGIAEMLLQSHDGAIHILPALPGKWSSGEVKGLKARGGFEIDMRWENGQIEQLTVHSKLGGNCRIRSAVPLLLEGGKKLQRAEGTNPNFFYQKAEIKKPLVSKMVNLKEGNNSPGMVYDLDAMKNESYVLIVDGQN